jgi:hypothetical protein
MDKRAEAFHDKVELIERVPRLAVPSVDAIARAHDVEPEDIPVVFEHALAEATDVHAFTHLNTLYQIWRAASEDPRLSAFAEGITTAEAVMARHPHLDLLEGSAILKHFTTHVFRPHGLLTLSTGDNTTMQYGAYDLAGEWLRLPLVRDRGQQLYARRDVLEEAAALEAAIRRPEADIFHATSSAALPGIARHRAILSARAAAMMDQAIASGEYLHNARSGQPSLESIYMSNLLDDGYSTLRWFNEFPVVFGCNAADVERYAAHHLGGSSMFRGAVANGHEVGPSLPIDMATTLYAPAVNLPLLLQWRDAVLPSAPVISLEAGMFLRLFSSRAERLYPDYLYRYYPPSERSTEAILGQRPIVIGE